MQELISNQLSTISTEHNVRVLHAVESGSRAWGFPSTDSDYDVRFLYVHNLEWYLFLQEQRDLIECSSEGELLLISRRERSLIQRT